MMENENRGWFKPRKLPHFDAGETTQFITFRLADSLPHTVIEQLRDEIRGNSPEAKTLRAKRSEEFLDQCIGSCILREEQCARTVQDAILFLSGK